MKKSCVGNGFSPPLTTPFTVPESLTVTSFISKIAGWTDFFLLKYPKYYENGVKFSGEQHKPIYFEN